MSNKEIERKVQVIINDALASGLNRMEILRAIEAARDSGKFGADTRGNDGDNHKERS